VNFELS